MSHNAKQNILALLSRCPVFRYLRSNTEYRQSKLATPLGLTVYIACLHKQKDPIKPKDPTYCRI